LQSDIIRRAKASPRPRRIQISSPTSAPAAAERAAEIDVNGDGQALPELRPAPPLHVIPAPKRARNPRTPKTAPPPEPPPRPILDELNRAVEDLVRQHTCGAVIDAAWAAAHRLFRPNQRIA
jgi:hypothetical protein